MFGTQEFQGKLIVLCEEFSLFESELGIFVFYEKVYLCHATAGKES